MLQAACLSNSAHSRSGELTIEIVNQPAGHCNPITAFCDTIHLGGRIALVAGDIYGAETSGAVRSEAVRSTLRKLMDEHDIGTAISRLNRMMYTTVTDVAADQCFLGLTVIIYEIGTGSIEVFVSGAERPIVIRPDRSLKSFKTHGLPLGIFPDVHCVPMRDRLNAGDLLVLSTDGVTSSRGGEGSLGPAGLPDLIGTMVRTTPPDRIGDCLVRKVLECGGGRLDHDACVLIASRS